MPAVSRTARQFTTMRCQPCLVCTKSKHACKTTIRAHPVKKLHCASQRKKQIGRGCDEFVEPFGAADDADQSAVEEQSTPHHVGETRVNARHIGKHQFETLLL